MLRSKLKSFLYIIKLSTNSEIEQSFLDFKKPKCIID